MPVATKAMRSFDVSLKEGECRLDSTLLAVNGWLNIQGDLYACGWLQHDKSVRALGFRNERDAAKAGYIRLSSLKWQIETRFSSPVLISEAQSNTIQMWHKQNNLSSDYFNYCLRKEVSRVKKGSDNG